ncbi:selenoneine biosynthesis selenosugar synthase SenB [Marinobacter halotolerans]|uniref:selenoneine biosynthesis selenosugar synthase SenB n=1 Tax=Marinobacter halotolerans TaxID=1569211 RepID=UPI001247A685|nr:selenoneine biosynthesis selenosugar synthase SenB [Marinobacter halotolerans]
MNIVLITPAPAGSKAGNRATAERWAKLLEQEGHHVSILTDFQDEPCDLLIALHAWRSHLAVRRFREAFPDIPLIVALTGTDIYDHQLRFPEQTLETMEQADCLIGLHERVARDIPERFGEKLVTVLQSAQIPERLSGKKRAGFQVCVIGHLREEKDSLRAAFAARLVPAKSTLKVINAGKPHNEQWESLAREELATNPRFEWLGEVSREEVQALMLSSDAMVISSIMEGGANVVSEACRIGLPVLASDISGNIGLLGDGYPGYFKTGSEEELARLLWQAESSPEFLADLAAKVGELAVNFTPQQEQAALARALKKALAARQAGSIQPG